MNAKKEFIFTCRAVPKGAVPRACAELHAVAEIALQSPPHVVHCAILRCAAALGWSARTTVATDYRLSSLRARPYSGDRLLAVRRPAGRLACWLAAAPPTEFSTVGFCKL